MKQLLSLSIILFTFVLSVSSFASNLRFLKDSPVSFYSKQETNLMEDNVYKALDELADGEQHNWQSPDSNSKGSISIEKTYTEDGKKCREAKLMNSAKGQVGNTKFKFCKDKDSWKIVN